THSPPFDYTRGGSPGMRDNHGSFEATVLQNPPPSPGSVNEVLPPSEMETEDAPRLNLWRVNFQELYERHLCRHSQYGLNVAHLATVVGCYLGLFALALWLVESPWIVAAIPLPYLGVLAFNIPWRVLLATMVFVAAFLALLFA